MSRPTSTYRALAVFFSVGLYAPLLAAQEIPSLWHPTLELGFTGASGNTSFSVLSTAASLTRLHRERFEFELSGKFRWGKSDGEVIANDVQATIKVDWVPNGEWSPFLYATASRDVIRNLDSRLVAGGGTKWTFFQPSDNTKMSISAAAVVDYENYLLPVGSTDPETVYAGRWSARVKFDHEFGSGTTFQHVSFLQPRMTNFGDYLVDVSNSLSTTLVSNISLVIHHSYIHDEVPPPGTVQNDQRLSVVLRMSL